MILEQVRRELRSDARIVVVVAPAGCGKTYEACEYALTVAEGLCTGQRVLFLAHTNAAVQEFRVRTRNQIARVEASTIDSFCLEILLPYASRMGLPRPLQHRLGRGKGRVPFAELATRVDELFRRCPSLARIYGLRYPVIILDEHQDASEAQHHALCRVAAAGQGKIRIFGDPMQAIFDEDDEQSCWPKVEADADSVVQLTEPQRWKKTCPALGDWILRCRAELENRRPLPRIDDGVPVRIRPLPMADKGFRTPLSKDLVIALHEILSGPHRSTALLSRYNQQARDLCVACKGRVKLNEGVEFADAYSYLAALRRSAGNTSKLANALVDVIAKATCGITKRRRTAIAKLITASGVIETRDRGIEGIARPLLLLNTSPTLATACRAIKVISEHRPAWLSIQTPECLRILGDLRPGPDDDPEEVLRQAIIRYKRRLWRPRSLASTIHKAKGLEFQHVVLVHFGSNQFTDSYACRKLAYVALSRAQESIDILVPKNPTALLAVTE